MRRLGLALSAGRVWATVPIADRWSDPAGLVQALVEAAGAHPAHLYVALLPDLCHVRQVALPPMNPEDRRSVLARTMTRHVPRGSEPTAFGASPVPGGVMVATAPAVLVEGLERACAAVKWQVTVSSAVGAWVAADRGATMVVPWWGGQVTITSDDRRITGVRRLPASLRPGAAGGDAERSAARHAHAALAPKIVSDERWARARARRRRTRRLGAVVAAVLVVFATGAAWWADARELTGLRERRAAHAPAVAQALDLRDRVTAAQDRQALLDGATRRWSAVLHDVGDHLPRTAFLSAFRAEGDSVSIEGYAREAAPVLDALRTTRSVAALRATAPIRRETRGDQAVERFVLGARLREMP